MCGCSVVCVCDVLCVWFVCVVCCLRVRVVVVCVLVSCVGVFVKLFVCIVCVTCGCVCESCCHCIRSEEQTHHTRCPCIVWHHTTIRCVIRWLGVSRTDRRRAWWFRRHAIPHRGESTPRAVHLYSVFSAWRPRRGSRPWL